MQFPALSSCQEDVVSLWIVFPSVLRVVENVAIRHMKCKVTHVSVTGSWHDYYIACFRIVSSVFVGKDVVLGSVIPEP